MIQRRVLDTKHFKILGIDEIEEMCLTSKDALYDVFTTLPQDIQVVACGSVIDTSLEITRKFVRSSGVWLLIPNLVDVLLEGVKRFYVNVEKEEWKVDTLTDLLENVEFAQTVIFVNTRRKVDWLAEQLRNRSFPVSSLVCS